MMPRAALILFSLIALLAATALAAPVACAQGSASPAISAAPAKPAAAGGGFYEWVAAKQSDYNRRLAALIREIRTGDPTTATLLLAVLSFVYGVLHAAGPGHGKAIISSYVLANEQTVRRGILLSFMAAAFQAVSAILLVAVLVLVFRAGGATRQATEAWLETISWGLIAALGAWLLFGHVKRLLARRRLANETPGIESATLAAGHGRSARVGAETAVLPSARAADDGHERQPRSHAHHHGHDHRQGDHGACCDHEHMPDPRRLQGEWSWPRALALAGSVGIRPCTGAVFVLGFALSQGLLWAGIFATFAMAFGTALTVSALAAFAVGSRELAARMGGGSSGWGTTVRSAAGLLGSFAVMVLGLVLFVGSLGPRAL